MENRSHQARETTEAQKKCYSCAETQAIALQVSAAAGDEEK
ncbi:hypothetical protein [Phormidium sp. CCY1219]|nr:hypothetical protein [Phormidium sp. CCY1219]